MKNEDIKKECERLYETISASEERLKEIRGKCPHEETYEGTYSYRVGAYHPATICSVCGGVVKYTVQIMYHK